MNVRIVTQYCNIKVGNTDEKYKGVYILHSSIAEVRF